MENTFETENGSPVHVVHAPIEIAGQLTWAALGERELGARAVSLARPHQFDYEPPVDILLRSPFQSLRAAGRAARSADVLHFYFGQSFLPLRLDARWLSKTSRRVVVEFLGSDVRIPSVEERRNPYYVQIDGESDKRARWIMRQWSKITKGHVIVCDHALDVFLAPYFPHIHVVGQRVDTQKIVPSPPDPNARRMLVVHSPTDRAAKGTRFVRDAVKELKMSGAPIDYEEVYNVSHTRALEIYATADLVVDQLCGGGHGVFAVEAMSMAKPVVCYLLPELEGKYPADLPIINASPATVKQVLAEWAEQPHARYERGLASRAYAERVHDCRVVAGRLLDVYDLLPR